MRALELIAGLAFALLLFGLIKLVGFVLHVALIGAVIGALAAILILRLLRPR